VNFYTNFLLKTMKTWHLMPTCIAFGQTGGPIQDDTLFYYTCRYRGREHSCILGWGWEDCMGI